MHAPGGMEQTDNLFRFKVFDIEQRTARCVSGRLW